MCFLWRRCRDVGRVFAAAAAPCGVRPLPLQADAQVLPQVLRSLRPAPEPRLPVCRQSHA